MDFKGALKINKKKGIITLVIGLIWYALLYVGLGVCKQYHEIIPEGIYNKYSFHIVSETCPITQVSTLIFDYLLLIIPIVIFYLVYSYREFKKTR